MFAYLENGERRQLALATVGCPLARLAVVHALLGALSLTHGSIVRDALRGFRRRVGVAQRQAAPICGLAKGSAACRSRISRWPPCWRPAHPRL